MMHVLLITSTVDWGEGAVTTGETQYAVDNLVKLFFVKFIL